MEDNLEDINYFIKTLQEEQMQEISNLKSQIVSYITRIKDYKHQLITLEKARIDDKFIHTTTALNIDEKYKNTRLMLISQIKLLSNYFVVSHMIITSIVLSLYKSLRIQTIHIFSDYINLFKC